MKIWAKTDDFHEGKFLVVRRDGSIPAWPHFVMGARDPAVPFALRAYADKCAELGLDVEYVNSLYELADDFEAYRAREGNGDADAAPHRQDNPEVLDLMAGRATAGAPLLIRDQRNQPKDPLDPATETSGA